IGIDDLTGGARDGLPLASAQRGTHEIIAHPYGVVRVLPTDRAIGFAVEVALVAHRDQGLSLAFLAHLPLNEIRDLGMIHVEADHLGGASRGATALGSPCRTIEHFEKAHHPAGGPAAAELFLLAANAAEVATRARTVLEQPRL